MAADQAAAVMQVAMRMGRALRAAGDPAGLGLWQSNGEAGGQEVSHFHLHVHPRRIDDGLLRIYRDGAPPHSGAGQRDVIAQSLRAHLDS